MHFGVTCVVSRRQTVQHVKLEDGLVIPNTAAVRRSSRQREASGRDSGDTAETLNNLRVSRKIEMLKELHERKGTAYKARVCCVVAAVGGGWWWWLSLFGWWDFDELVGWLFELQREH